MKRLIFLTALLTMFLSCCDFPTYSYKVKISYCNNGFDTIYYNSRHDPDIDVYRQAVPVFRDYDEKTDVDILNVCKFEILENKLSR